MKKIEIQIGIHKQNLKQKLQLNDKYEGKEIEKKKRKMQKQRNTN